MTEKEDTRARFLAIESDIKGINKSVADINTNVELIAQSVSAMPDDTRVKEISRDIVELERLREMEKRELSKKAQVINWQKYKPVIKYALVVIVTTVLTILGAGSVPG